MLRYLRFRSVLTIVAVATAVGVSSFACAKPPAPSPVTKLRVGYVPIADCLQLYVALDQGIFAKYGLDVEVTSLQAGPRIIEAMSAGSLDVGIANVVSVTVAHVRGVQLVSITGGAMEIPDRQTRALLVSADSTIKSAADLVGKKVAVNGLRTIEQVKLVQYLELHKIPVDKVSVVEAPFPQMEGVLMNNSVAAGMAIEPYLSLALKHGTVRVLGRPYTETSSRTFVSSYVALSPWLDQHQNAAKAFAQSIADATDFINQHPDEARRIVLKYAKLPNEVASEVTLPHFEAYFDAKDLQPMIDELARQGIIPATVPAADVFKRY